MQLEDSLEVFRPVAQALEELGISYRLGGSVASSIYGMPRGTSDVDVEADLREEHIAPFVARLEAQFIVSEAMVRDALFYRNSFNLIPYDAIAKVDIFIPQNRPFDQSAARRGQKNLLLEDGSRLPYVVDSVEDAILRKLEWYRKGHEVSEQKWLDVLAMMKAQFFDLDVAYLQQWARELNVDYLLARALDEAGLSA